MLEACLCFSTEQRHHVAHGQLARSCLALDGCVGQLALAFLEVEDSIFDRVFDGELVYFHVQGLVDTVNSIDGLFFDELCYPLDGKWSEL